MDLIKRVVTEQPFIVAQVSAVAMLLISMGVQIDLAWLDTALNAAFAVLALAVEVWGWRNVTPLARPRDNDGNNLVPAGEAG